MKRYQPRRQHVIQSFIRYVDHFGTPQRLNDLFEYSINSDVIRIKQLAQYILYNNGYPHTVYKQSIQVAMSGTRNMIFFKLKKLLISQTQVYNIQWITGLEAPSLQVIILNRNKISNVASLRKIQSQNIIQIDISNNLVNNADILVQTNWKIQEIKNQCQSVGFCAKLPKNSSKSCLHIDSDERINEKQLIQSFVRKNSNKSCYIRTKNGSIGKK